MKTRFSLQLFFTMLVAFNVLTINAQTVNENVSLTWPFGLGTNNQVCTIQPTVAHDYFTTDWTTVSSNLNYDGFILKNGVTFTKFKPTVQNNSATANDIVAFNFRPKTGLKFTPTSIAFDCQRFGTDNGKIDVSWKSSDGTITSIATGLSPARDNSGGVTKANYDLSTLTIPESGSDCGLLIYIYSIGSSKQIGLANVVVGGHIQGTIENVVTHTLSTTVSPVNAGTISNIPIGTTFNAGTNVQFTAARKFGYQFKEWRNTNDDSLISTDNPVSITITSDLNLKAVFEPINTYSLAVNIQGGAASYMVSANPSGTVVDGKTMYEEGTSVTLTTTNNKIFSFTNWLTGQTTSSLTVAMTQNQNITAVYSALDYIAGWDFYRAGYNGRPADFYSTDENIASNLVLRKEDGALSGWLDKSNAAGGYYDRGCAVNWKSMADKYYYQIQVNAKDFTNLAVSAGMLYNYNAYSVQQCEYSLDNINFTTIGTYNLSAAQTWFDQTFTLPADANHAEKVYIRWIPDYSSAIVGTNYSNDGTSISNIYVTAQSAIFNDGVAPVLISSLPAAGATTVSASGKIVLNFDEKVKLTSANYTGTLNGKSVTPVVTGNSITFSYSGLDYNTSYTFTFPANSISDLSDNVFTDAVSIAFTTMTKPVVTKKLFDFVVGVDGDFKAAITAATAASASVERFRIFFPDGEYNLGTNTGDANQKTVVALPNISYIGQSAEGVVLFNKPTTEGIGVTATINFNSSANNLYLQDITLLNKMDYRTGTLLGRAVALQDQGNKNIYKNVNLLSNQDTYYSGNGRMYFEGGSIHGTVDFICGGGDVFFNETLLYLENRAGNCVTAPATSTNWGYVFSNCTIDGFPINNGGYRLGRPWQNAPKAVFINTTMNVLPTAEGWGEMQVVPALFAEYNSKTSTGAIVDLSNRKKVFTYDGVSTTVNPYLTAEQAAAYTIANVLGGADSWQPTLYAEQIPAPVIVGNNNTLTWNDNNYVLCWAIFKDNVFVKFVTTNSYEIPSNSSTSVYTVRAANEMGGLGAVSNPYTFITTETEKIFRTADLVSRTFFSVDGRQIVDVKSFKGVVIVRSVYSDGSVVSNKTLKTTNN